MWGGERVSQVLTRVARLLGGWGFIFRGCGDPSKGVLYKTGKAGAIGQKGSERGG